VTQRRPAAPVSIDRTPEPGEVTRLLREVRSGNGTAIDQVMALMYDDLRALARSQLRREYAARTLEPTTLVHEAYLKMVRGANLEAMDRGHLLALAAHAMRQVLVDYARRRKAAKRADAWKQVTLTDGGPESGLDAEALLALDDALEQLEPRQRQIVECRFFAGMDDAEIAATLGVTDRTVRREWVKARARLNRVLYGSEA
jgi:RNA polymerase sigma factor (TIGR02999 family)